MRLVRKILILVIGLAASYEVCAQGYYNVGDVMTARYIYDDDDGEYKIDYTTQFKVRKEEGLIIVENVNNIEYKPKYYLKSTGKEVFPIHYVFTATINKREIFNRFIGVMNVEDHGEPINTTWLIKDLRAAKAVLYIQFIVLDPDSRKIEQVSFMFGENSAVGDIITPEKFAGLEYWMMNLCENPILELSDDAKLLQYMTITVPVNFEMMFNDSAQHYY